MITRIYCDGFKSLENLDFQPDRIQLLFGKNGVGKSSIFDLLSNLRDLIIENERCDKLFPLTTVTRWRKTAVPSIHLQEFAVEMDGPDGGTLEYNLQVEQNESLAASRITRETLTADGRPLFEFQMGKVQLYKDSHVKGPEYTYDWVRSALGSVLPTKDNPRLGWFKDQMRKLTCVRIDAPRMSARSEREEPKMHREMWNFASWYRSAILSDVSALASFIGELKDVIQGLSSLDLKDIGQGIVIARAAFRSPDRTAANGKYKSYWLDLDELSDGQRALIGLYALPFFCLRDGGTLCIDEPDNFVALSEIQPWLSLLQDRTEETGAQVFIASHHPELLNALASTHGHLVTRKQNGRTGIEKFEYNGDDAVTPAELVARGWTHA